MVDEHAASAQDLLRRLDEADSEEREAIYSETPVELPGELVGAAVVDRRPCGDFLAHRYIVGPPGQPLPTPADALQAITDHSGGPADAYVLLFTAPEIPEELRCFAILGNAALCSLKGGLNWFSAFALSRAGLAASAYGELDWWFAVCDGLFDEVPPLLKPVGFLFELRSHPDLLADPWIKVLAAWLWGLRPLGSFPSLPSQAPGEGDPRSDLAPRLRAAGAQQTVELVQAWVRWVDAVVFSSAEEHPAVRAVQAAALRGDLSPPELSELPESFAVWAQLQLEAEAFEVARLAGLTLARDPQNGPLAGPLILPAVRARDVPVLRSILAAIEDRSRRAAVEATLDELESAAGRLPEEVADALVRFILAPDTTRFRSLSTLDAHRPLLEELPAIEGGVVQRFLADNQRARDDAARDQAEATGPARRLLRAIRVGAGLLTELPSVSAADVHRAVEGIDLPTSNQGLIDLLNAAELRGLEAVLRDLVWVRLLETGAATPRELGRALYFAQRAVFREVGTPLFDLRLDLLDRALEVLSDAQVRAELTFARGNTLVVLRAFGRSERDPRPDLEEALRATRALGLANQFADAASCWTRRVAAFETDPAVRARAVALLQEALDLTLESDVRATALQARAFLLQEWSGRSRVGHVEAAETLREALALLSPESAQYFDVGAELVQALNLAGQVETANEVGDRLVAELRPTIAAIERGLLLIAAGDAARAAGRSEIGASRLREAIGVLDGLDPRNARVARQHLIHELAKTDQVEAARRELSALAAAPSPDPNNHQEEASLEATLLELEGRFAEARAVLDRLAERGGPCSVTTEMHRTRVALKAGERVEGVESLLRRAMAEVDPVDDASVSFVTELLCNFGVEYSEPFLEHARAWTIAVGRPVVAVRLLDRLGRVDEALELLRHGLEEASGFERVRLLHALVATLPADESVERRQAAEELDALLDDFDVPAHLHVDLAVALRMVSESQPAVLRRALHHAQVAYKGATCLIPRSPISQQAPDPSLRSLIPMAHPGGDDWDAPASQGSFGGSGSAGPRPRAWRRQPGLLLVGVCAR